jgi:probable addiction module antidote protein
MLKTTKFDIYKHLKTEKDIKEYLEVVFENYSAEPDFITDALGVAAKARGMLKTAKETGLSRVGLYRSLTRGGDPKISTVSKVAHTLGYRLALVPLR